MELEGVSGHEHEQHETSDGQIQLTAQTLLHRHLQLVAKDG